MAIPTLADPLLVALFVASVTAVNAILVADITEKSQFLTSHQSETIVNLGSHIINSKLNLSFDLYWQSSRVSLNDSVP